MHSKWDTIRGNAGFFITLTVCLLTIAVCGYFLLFDDEETPPAPVSTPVAESSSPVTPMPEAPVTAPAEPLTEESVPAAAPVEEVSIPVREIITDDTPVTAEAPRLTVEPLEGDVITAFSVDTLVYNPTLADWRIHDGVDISAEEGSSVLAAASGTVIAVENDPLMGVSVTLSHEDGFHSTYANLRQEVPVRAGDAVSAGQIIGAVGNTAAAEANQPPHLHFSVTKDGDAVDPEEFLRK